MFDVMKQLRRIDLSDNALANDFKAPYAYDGVFTDSPLLESIDIFGNNFALAPLGMFVGLSNIRELDMSGNAVAVPPIIFLAARRDADGHEPPPAQVFAVALSDAIFPMSGVLTAKNAEGVPASVQLPAGGFWSTPFNVGQRTAGVGSEIRLRDATDIPDMQCGGRPCLRGGGGGGGRWLRCRSCSCSSAHPVRQTIHRPSHWPPQASPYPFRWTACSSLRTRDAD